MSTTSLESNMRATATAFLQSFSGDWQPGASLSYRAPECEHSMLPASLGTPKHSNEEWAAYFAKVAPLVKNAKMVIDDYLAVPNERRAVVRSSMSASTPVGPFKNEYVWFFTFDETGERIIKIDEFLDTAATNDIRARLAAMKEQSSEE